MVTGTIFDNGNIGIGTTNPATKLDVNGDGNINGPLSVAGILRVTETNIIEVMGTNILRMWPHRDMVTNLNADMLDGYHATNLPYMGTNYQFVEQDPRVKISDDNRVPRWNTASTALITGTIFDNGNVGIGAPSSGAKLDVNGNISTSDDIYWGTRGIWLSQWLDQALRTSASPIFGNLELRMNNADVKLLFLDQANYWYSMGIDYSDGSKLKINRGGNIGDYNDLTIDHTGNLGIGTTSPGAKLDVVGSIWANGSRPIKLNPAGSITIQAGPGGWADYLHFLGSSGTDRGGFGAAGSDDNLTYLYAGDSYSNPTMVWKGGNVGIGTPNPATRLDVNGDSIFRGTLTINRENGQLKLSGGTYNGGLWTDGHILRLDNWNTSVGALAVNLANGNVGIGTANPAYKLDVLGDAQIHGPLYLNFSDNRIEAVSSDFPVHPYLALTVADNYTVLKPSIAGFRVTNYENAGPPNWYGNNLILNNDGHLYLPYGILHEGSDSRLKLNQEPLDYGLDEVMEFQTVRYIRTSSVPETKTGKQQSQEKEAKPEIGLIAQQVYEIVPEAVAPPDEVRETWCLSYSSLIPVLVNAIQEQQQQIEELKDKINRLERNKKDK